MTPTIGDKIIQYSGDAKGEDQITVHSVLRTVTDEAVTIEKRSMKSFFDRNFRIPDYQRGYEWEEENWEQLWEEIKEVFEVDSDTVDNKLTDIFFGSMFFAERDPESIDLGPMEDDDGEVDIEILYDVIDGQQRITTLTIIFKIMADKLNYNIKQDTDLLRELGGEPSNIENLVYRNVGAGMEKEPSLLPNRHQRELFSAMMSDDEALIEYLLSRTRVHGNTKDDAIEIKSFLDTFEIEYGDYLSAVGDDDYYDQEIDGRPNLTSRQQSRVNDRDEDQEIGVDSTFGQDLLTNKVEINDDTQILIEAYDYFEAHLEQRLGNLNEPKERAYAIINVKNYLLHAFIVGYFEVQNNQPKLLMKIFEILNDRGMELKKADVMRTRIVACFRDDSERDDYVNTWEEIVDRFGNERIIDFLRTYFVARGSAKSRGELKDHLLEAFERNPSNGGDSKIESHLTDVEDAKKFLDELETYAEYYDDITDIQNRGVDLTEDGDENIEQQANRIISRLRKADTSIWEPLVLGIYHDIVEDDLSQESELTKLLRAIESMSIRKFAAMDTHTRDRVYSEAIEEYHENGLSGEVVGELTDIETDDPSAVGAQLVEELYRSDWQKQWGKQVLRKIVTENFSNEEDKMVLKKLNLDDDIVHLEHIFPQTPVRTSVDDEYGWFKNFFKTEHERDESEQESEIASDEEDEMSIETMVSKLVEQKKGVTLEEIAEEYVQDIGNLTLLHSEKNISIKNEFFDDKARAYRDTQSYCELATSQYICAEILSSHTDTIEKFHSLEAALEELETEEKEGDGETDEGWETIAERVDIDVESKDSLIEKINEELKELTEELESLRGDWTYDTVTQNRAHLIEELCELIAFKDDEFEEVDFESMSRDETETKNDIITANFRRRLQ